MVGAAKIVGGAAAQVAIRLVLEKAVFSKDVQKTTKETENAFSKSFNNVEKTSKSAFGKMGRTAKSAMSGIGRVAKTAFNGLKNVAGKALDKVKTKFSDSFRKISNIVKVAMVAASAFLIKFGKDAVDAASETQAAWTGLFSIVSGTGKSFTEAKGFLEEYVSDGLIPLTDAITSYKNLAARGYSTEQIEQTMLALKDAAAFGRQSSYSYGEAIKSATEGLKNENSILVDNAGVTKNVAKMWDDYAASIGTTANNLTQQQKIQAEVNGILEETRFQTGDAAKYADTYAGKIAKLKTAFYNLKVTVGQVLTPIIELFLPAITAAVNGLTKMFNKLKSIMAVFGLEMKEYVGGSNAISNMTEDASGLSSGLDSTGDAATTAAKKIKKAFAGVDEINVLNTKNEATGGSSGSGGSALDSLGGTDNAFDSMVDDEKVEKLEQNLDWLSRSAYDWGVAFGESLNKGLEKINWDTIQNTVNNVVRKFAEFLNGAVAGFDWSLLGNTIAEAINTVIYGMTTFLSTFGFEKFGTALGESVNGIFDKFDFEETGRMFGLQFNAIFDTAEFFLDEVDFGNIGKKFTEGINKMFKTADFAAPGRTLREALTGVIDFGFETVTTFDAVKAGEKIAEFVNSISDAIKYTDWGKLGKTFTTGFSKGVQMLRTWIKETDWGELVKNLIDGIVDFIVNVDWWALIGDILALLWDVGVALLDGLWEGIKAALVGVLDIIKAILIDPIVNAVKKLFGINSPSTVFAEMGDFLIQGLWQGIKDAKDWIVKKWESVKGWFSNITKEAKVAIKQKWSDIKQKWTDLTKNIKNKTADMKAKVASKWSDLKNKWSNITKNIKNKTADMKAKVASKWSDLRSKWNNLMSNFKDKTIQIKAKVGEVVGNFKSVINDKIIKPINSKLPDWIPKIPQLAQGGWLQANNPRLAIVGDNRTEGEIVAPESKIKEQVVKGIQEAGGTNTQQFEFTIKLEYPDGKYLIKQINDTQIRDGKISLLV